MPSSEVLSITVIDAPDAVNRIKAREFVVTSTYPLQQSPDALLAPSARLPLRLTDMGTDTRLRLYVAPQLLP